MRAVQKLAWYDVSGGGQPVEERLALAEPAELLAHAVVALEQLALGECALRKCETIMRQKLGREAWKSSI